MNWQELPPKDWTPRQIIEFRLRKGWSQTELAHHLMAGAVSTIRRWEKGLSRPQLYFRQMMSELEADLDQRELYELYLQVEEMQKRGQTPTG